MTPPETSDCNQSALASFAPASGSALADHAEWQANHQRMLQHEMQTSDRFLVEIASRLGVSCRDFAFRDTRQQYAELRERILLSLANDKLSHTAPTTT